MTLRAARVFLPAVLAAVLVACGGDKPAPPADAGSAPVAEEPAATPLPEATPAEAAPAPAPTPEPGHEPAPPTPEATDEPATGTGTAPTTATVAVIAPTAAPPTTSITAVSAPPVPVVTIDPATTPGESVEAIRTVLRGVDPLSKPSLEPEKEALMQAHIASVTARVEQPGAYPKDTREAATELAGKIQYQLEQARNAGNADVYIGNLKRVEELLTQLEGALEAKE